MKLTIPKLFNKPQKENIFRFGGRMSAPAKELLAELGVVQDNEAYKGITFYPYNPDDLIDREGIGIYDEVQKDATVRAVLNLKKFAVVGSDWNIIAGGDDDRDIEIAEFVRFNFEHMRGSFTKFLFNVLDALAKGFSVHEILWEQAAGGKWTGKWRVSAIKSKDPKDYEFDIGEFGQVEALLLKTQSAPSGKPVPTEKFLVYSYNSKYEQPWGQSDLRAIYKHWWSKDFMLKWLNLYLETYGMPLRVGKFPRGKLTQAEQTRLKNTLRDIMNNTAMTIPDDIVIEFHDAVRGGGDAFLGSIRHHNEEIIRGILGATLTAGEGERVGSMALGVVHEAQQETFIDHLRRDVEEAVIDEQLICRIVDYNYENVEFYPYFKFTPPKMKLVMEKVEDIRTLVETGIILGSDIGWVRERLDLPLMEIQKKEEEKEEREEEAPAVTTGHAFGLSRRPYAAERRVDFQRMDRAMVDDAERMRVGLSEVVERMRDNFMRDVYSQVFKGGAPDWEAIKGLRLQGLRDFSTVLLDNFNEITDREYRVAAKEVGKFAKFDFAAVTVSAEAIPPAVEIAKVKKWVEQGEWGKVTEWRDRKIAALKAQNKLDAFWVTDVEKDYILSQVKNKIMGGLRNGLTVPEIMDQVKTVFEKYIARGELKNVELAKAPRLETIVRTNTTRVFAQARKEVAQDPIVMGEMPGLMFSAILDDRTTEQCQALDGSVYPADDPIWGRITPPLHFNCRSTVVSVYKDDLPKKWAEPPDLTLIPEQFGGM